MNNYLQHHGIRGMKWGIRRFQNYDGSYTKAGLARYKTSEQKYDSAAKRTENAKTRYKSGEGSKQAYKAAKKEQKNAKKELSKAYDSLKNDYNADKGKELYRSGKTIEAIDHDKRAREYANLAAYGLAGLSYAALKNSKTYVHTKYGPIPVAKIAPSAIMIGTGIVNQIIQAKEDRERRQLRAYYAH